MNNNKLEILVTAKDAASDIIKGVGKSFGHLSDAAMTGSKAMAAGVAAAAAATVAFGKSSVDAYFGAAEASAKLSTNLLNVKGNTNENVKALEGLASQLQAVGVIEDDVIKAGMSQLATFNLQGATIAKVTPKIADMVAQMKGHNATAEDMVGINNLVGKVLTGNVGALSRYGVTLSENQQKLLENGDEAKRAAVLVEVLGQNYGNVNEELAKTPQGMITQLKNNFGDLQEGVGEFLVQAAQPVLKWFDLWMYSVNEAGGFMAYFSKVIDENKEMIIRFVGAITAILIPALALWAYNMTPIVAAIAILGGIGAVLGPPIQNLINQFGGWGQVMENIGAIFQRIWGWIQQGIDFLRPSIEALGNALREHWLPRLQELWNFVEPVLVPALKWLGIIIGVTLVGAIYAIVNAITGLVYFFALVYDSTKAFINMVLQMYTMVIGYMQQLYNGWVSIWTAIINFAIGIFTGLRAFISGIISGIIATVWGVHSGITGAFAAAINGVRSIWGGITGFFSGIVSGIRNIVSGVTDAIMSPFNRAVDMVRGIPGRIISALGNIGGLIRDTLGNFDIPGPLGRVRDVIPGFATGGFTGHGGTNEVAGIVHKGEYVVPKNQVDQHSGLPMLGGGGNIHVEIHGNVVNETPEAARAFWQDVNRAAELAALGAPQEL